MSADNTGKTSQSQEFHGVHLIEKERGETLAVLLERFRALHDLDSGTKLTYAGRLDPMAEGLVIILAGDDRFKKDTLLRADKTYIVQVLLGIGTDSLDPLGRIEKVDAKDVSKEAIEKAVEKMKGIRALPYPMYSSVPVDGVPLFVHARAGQRVLVPEKKVTIHSVVLESIRTESLESIVDEVVDSVQKVVGDFRQAETITGWKELVNTQGAAVPTIVRLVIKASSGTYMRSLAKWLGDELGVPALAYTIKRSEIAIKN